MLRAFFLALGIFLAAFGAQCLAVDRFIMASQQPQSVPYGSFQPAPAPAKEMVPPEWLPWTLLSTGTVVVLYSLTINKQG
jgi:hypothetical protein